VRCRLDLGGEGGKQRLAAGSLGKEGEVAGGSRSIGETEEGV